MKTFRIDDLILESRRKGNKITQKQLAEAANVVPTTINKIIHGETQAPKMEILIAIASVFTEALGREIKVDDLIDKQNSVPPSQAVPEAEPATSPDISEVADAIPDCVLLPLYGEIPCGDLNLIGEEHILEHMAFATAVVDDAKFLLKAQGDSMTPTIKDGDILFIEPGRRWENRAIVIAWTDDQVTCKRLYLTIDNAYLMSDNKDYAEQIIPVTDQTILLGKVVSRHEFF